MMAAVRRTIADLPTPAKLLLFLSAALLPFGAAQVWNSTRAIDQANQALRTGAEAESFAAARAVDSLIARNALALRIAASGALPAPGSPCEAIARSLSITPAMARDFVVRADDPARSCLIGDNAIAAEVGPLPVGEIRLWIPRARDGIGIQVGVQGGTAAARLTLDELRDAAQDARGSVSRLLLTDGARSITLVARPAARATHYIHRNRYALGGDRIQADVEHEVPRIDRIDRLFLLLPVLMWLVAAILSWWLVHHLLTRPLRRLQAAVTEFQPGDHELALPERLGPATEIRELGAAFQRAVQRIDESERTMADALDGQKRLVREVHHRVKNNLQVVASLLNIHSRVAETPEAKAAYSAITRRVDALSVVHRNHFAEIEDNRGIQLRPLLTELAAGLRASAPDEARTMAIDLDLESASTTQDVAVAVAFLVTEIVEFAMLRRPKEPIEIYLRRSSELTARMTLCSPVLKAGEKAETGDKEREMFERVVEGLARQLRSPLERKLGRYSVSLPVFPE